MSWKDKICLRLPCCITLEKFVNFFVFLVDKTLHQIILLLFEIHFIGLSPDLLIVILLQKNNKIILGTITMVIFDNQKCFINQTIKSKKNKQNLVMMNNLCLNLTGLSNWIKLYGTKPYQQINIWLQSKNNHSQNLIFKRYFLWKECMMHEVGQLFDRNRGSFILLQQQRRNQFWCQICKQ